MASSCRGKGFLSPTRCGLIVPRFEPGAVTPRPGFVGDHRLPVRGSGGCKPIDRSAGQGGNRKQRGRRRNRRVPPASTRDAGEPMVSLLSRAWAPDASSEEEAKVGILSAMRRARRTRLKSAEMNRMETKKRRKMQSFAWCSKYRAPRCRHLAHDRPPRGEDE